MGMEKEVFMGERDGYTYLADRRFVRYATGAKLYDMSQSSFEDLAHLANAVSKVGKIALVDRRIVDEYLEMCRVIN